MLVTSRDSAWQGIADPVSVDLLSAEDAVELLVRRTGDPTSRRQHGWPRRWAGYRWR